MEDNIECLSKKYSRLSDEIKLFHDGDISFEKGPCLEALDLLNRLDSDNHLIIDYFVCIGRRFLLKEGDFKENYRNDRKLYMQDVLHAIEEIIAV